jgi:hypothetical protein
VEGSFRVQTEVLSRHLPGGLKKTTKNLSRDIGASVEILTEYLPNSSLERYRCSDLPGIT